MSKSQSMQTLLYLDRYEDEYAVLIDPDTRKSIDIPRNLLPNNIPECTYVSLTITPDKIATQSAVEETAQLINELTGENT